MNYTSLIAAKGTTGAIATWVAWTLLDTATILDEAQALIYQALRCREMRSMWSFQVDEGYCSVSLPSDFLDPIGRMRIVNLMTRVRHRDTDFVDGRRMYEVTTGSLGADPLTTTSGSSLVTVALTANGFRQGGMFSIAGAATVGGLTLNGSYLISTPGTNSFVIDAESSATSSATGGGSSITYSCSNLTEGVPADWGIWDEKIQFDCAADQNLSCRQPYYRKPELLSATNQTNFLTNRYPQILRTACQAAAADFMKDDTEYKKGMARLGTLIASAASENDLEMRGMEHQTETP